MLEKGAPFTAHILHEVLRNEAKVFFDLLDESVAVFEVQMPKTQYLFEIVG